MRKEVDAEPEARQQAHAALGAALQSQLTDLEQRLSDKMEGGLSQTSAALDAIQTKHGHGEEKLVEVRNAHRITHMLP